MTDTFNPGEGWREVTKQEWLFHPDDDEDNVLAKIGGVQRRWVRKDPASALPTEPGYYLAVDGSVYRLDTSDEDPVWDDTFGNPQDDVDLRRVLPFERIEPRAVTAKAVLDRFESVNWITDSKVVDTIARDFGVES